MDRTTIEWTDATWNPVTGCTQVSPGCDHCYALTLAERFRGTPSHYFEHGFDVQLRPAKLHDPLRWKKPRRIFVNSMSDLFHDDVPDAYIAEVFAVMAQAAQHTFQVLTKRHGRMRALLNSDTFLADVDRMLGGDGSAQSLRDEVGWPLSNVWLGVSVENQQWADIRVPALLGTPAAVRFLSMEPLLGSVDLSRWLPAGTCQCEHAESEHYFGPGDRYGRTVGCQGGDGSEDNPICGCRKLRGEHEHNLGDHYLNHGVHWVIVGGESGRGARPMHPDWARSLRDQCQAAGVPFLFKQWGEWQDGSAAPDQRGEDHIIVADGRHEPARDHWAEDEKGRWTSDLIRARSRREPGTDRACFISRVGKKAAGRELDGRTWDEFPAVTQ